NLTTNEVPSDQASQIGVGFGGKSALANITIKNTTGGNQPTITSIVPNTGSAAGGQTVTIYGSNLKFATAVTFGGTLATTAYNPNTGNLQPATPAHDSSTVDVTVTTPAGSTTLSGGFTYISSALSKNLLTVSGGTGGGSYSAGTVVPIYANA